MNAELTSNKVTQLNMTGHAWSSSHPLIMHASFLHLKIIGPQYYC